MNKNLPRYKTPPPPPPKDRGLRYDRPPEPPSMRIEDTKINIDWRSVSVCIVFISLVIYLIIDNIN